MAQMPASYLDEKVAAIHRSWSNTKSHRGIIELDDRNREYLRRMAIDAQAIIDEINQWTGVDA